MQLDDLNEMLKDEFDLDAKPKPKKTKKVKTDDDEEEEQEEQPVQKEDEVCVPEQIEELSEELLRRAIFELADTWCPNVDHEEYIEFLKILMEKYRYQKNMGDGGDPYMSVL